MKFEFFPCLLLGHMVGDYLLQNKWMAMNKSGSTWKCVVHCLLYTAAVVSLTWPVLVGWKWAAWVFLSHFPVDRWSLADKWLDFIGSRNLPDFVRCGHQGIPTLGGHSSSEEELLGKNYWALRAAFTGVVYAAADNTMHLVLMYYGAKLFFGA